ncbi:MAG: DUF4340 domain-containing protein [Candidatus Omnitrophica bacterium]|nr:DUF4340 domain-containing protein [Candidatus Omnitrophota bacterium]
MKTKHVIILAAVLAVLMLTLLAKKTFRKPEVEVSEYETVNFSFDSSLVSAIEIKNPSSKEPPLRLNRSGSMWTIPLRWDAQAKEYKIKDFMKDINALEGEVRARNKRLFKDFRIEDEEALSITFYCKEDEVLERFFVGLQKPAPGRSFIRREGSDEVILADKDIFTLLGIYGDPYGKEANVTDWLELSFIEIEVDKIEGIKVVSYDQGPLRKVDIVKVLDEEKDMKQWISELKETLFPLNARKIRSYLRSLRGLSAEDIANPNGKGYGFDDPYFKLILTYEEGYLEYMVGSTSGEGLTSRYLRTPEDNVYIIGKSTLDNMNIDTSEFFIDNPLRIDVETLEGVRIKSGGEVFTLGKDAITEDAEYVKVIEKFEVKNLVFDKEYANGLTGPVDNSLTLTRKGGEELTVLVKKIDSDTYYAQIQGKPDVFAMSGELFESLFNDLDRLNRVPSGTEGIVDREDIN